ncbi:hypothetical protein DPMN_062042 [Dreissena polymorpha]|uniref:Uncharacterized protein n=1 Tax=Dreissena polymorpha TaxID=45954 RepID=A0A9D4HHF4_DREPO|nr:hypothetical protein DPMN_062042 [Dreissena polymorpha]
MKIKNKCVISKVLKRKTDLQIVGQFNIIGKNLLTKKTSQHPCVHVFQQIYWSTNMTSRLLTRNTAVPSDSHVFQGTLTILEISPDIIRIIKCSDQEDWTINVTS